MIHLESVGGEPDLDIEEIQYKVAEERRKQAAQLLHLQQITSGQLSVSPLPRKAPAPPSTAEEESEDETDFADFNSWRSRRV